MKNNPIQKLPADGKTYNSHLNHHLFRLLFVILMVTLFTLLGSQTAYSVPGFAKQTGLSCSTCHSMFPELNSFGREFKLNGYTFTNFDSLIVKKDQEETLSKLLSYSPLSVMVQTSFTNLTTKIPGTQNSNVEFPQQLSLLYAGMISPHLGTFIQLTYAGQDGAIGMDNVDIRYNNMTLLGSKRLVYGLTLNNNPSIQDVWNSSAGRFPYVTSGVTPVPAASTLIEGALGQQVAGLGAYAFFNKLVYAEFSVYRSAPQGAPLPLDSAAIGIIRGVAPYWRLALQHDWQQKHYLEIGTSGISTSLYPTGVTGLTNSFTDIGFDLLYEYTLRKGIFRLQPSWYHENQKLDAALASGGSVNRNNTLNSLKISAEIYTDKGFGAALGYFSVNGSQDTGIFAPGAISGSRIGKPDSDGFIAEFSYLPWLNTKLSLQYIMYNKFNGASTNYDGFGRNASDNNSLYLLLWFCF